MKIVSYYDGTVVDRSTNPRGRKLASLSVNELSHYLPREYLLLV